MRNNGCAGPALCLSCQVVFCFSSLEVTVGRMLGEPVWIQEVDEVGGKDFSRDSD